MAFQLRKRLLESGEIAHGYVDFPARLMTNIRGDVNGEGKKIYRCYRNFSKEPVE